MMAFIYGFEKREGKKERKKEVSKIN